MPPKSGHRTAKVLQFPVTGLKSGHRTAEVGSLRTNRFLWMGLISQKRPWNRQGRRFVDSRCHASQKRPWNRQGWQFEDVTMKLLRSSSLSPRKKVWLKPPRSAVSWPLFQTSIYGRCSQVRRMITVMSRGPGLCPSPQIYLAWVSDNRHLSSLIAPRQAWLSGWPHRWHLSSCFA